MNTQALSSCPCGNSKNYDACCGQYIQGTAIPKTPEALMRSRYTAYTQGDISYIQKTMAGPAAEGFEPKDAADWAQNASWRGLEIIEAKDNTVLFKAHYAMGNQKEVIHEKSEFTNIDGRWYYTNTLPLYPTITPVQSKKIPRNDPCPCGSGKKYKKCCALS